MLSRFFHVQDPLSVLDAFERHLTHPLFDSHPRSFSRDPSEITVKDTGDSLVLTASLPGVAAGDLEITFERDVLTLKAERKAEPAGDYKVVRRERGSLRLSRQLELGVPIQSEKIDARLVDGVLTLTLPKAPEAQPKKISVKTAAVNVSEPSA